MRRDDVGQVGRNTQYLDSEMCSSIINFRNISHSDVNCTFGF